MRIALCLLLCGSSTLAVACGGTADPAPETAEDALVTKTSMTEVCAKPVVSGDGRYALLVQCAAHAGNKVPLVHVDLQTGISTTLGTFALSFHEQPSGPSWRPSERFRLIAATGNHFAFLDGNEIHVRPWSLADAETTAAGQGSGSPIAIAVSGDGKKIATHRRHTTDFLGDAKDAVVVQDLATGTSYVDPGSGLAGKLDKLTPAADDSGFLAVFEAEDRADAWVFDAVSATSHLRFASELHPYGYSHLVADGYLAGLGLGNLTESKLDGTVVRKIGNTTSSVVDDADPSQVYAASFDGTSTRIIHFSRGGGDENVVATLPGKVYVRGVSHGVAVVGIYEGTRSVIAGASAPVALTPVKDPSPFTIVGDEVFSFQPDGSLGAWDVRTGVATFAPLPVGVSGETYGEVRVSSEGGTIGVLKCTFDSVTLQQACSLLAAKRGGAPELIGSGKLVAWSVFGDRLLSAEELRGFGEPRYTVHIARISP